MIAAILDHLWQSTLFALAAGLLAAALRKAPAAARYGLWFAASAKFLIPFAALSALGRVLAPRLGAPGLLASMGLPPVHATPEAALIQTAAQPFAKAISATDPLAGFPSDPAAIVPAQVSPVHAAAQPALHLDPVLILVAVWAAVWAAGCIAVLVRWMIRAMRVRAAVRSARPLAWPAPMPVLASTSLMEPGLVGLVRPVLLVPQTLPGRLTRSEIDAIVAHEAWHLRRKDNLTAAFHMLVEALFWFHPLVWRIGARMIAERETACDEAVVKAGHDRAAYARSLVESCRLYLQSPLDCVAGASGSDLKARVEAIMTAPPTLPLSLSKKALLAVAGVCVFATPVAAALVAAPEAGKPASAPAQVLAAIAAPARTLAAPVTAAADDTDSQPIGLTPAAPVLATPVALAANDAAPPLAQEDLAAPQIESAQPAAADEVASAGPAPASLTRVAATAPSAGETSEVSAFVKSYGQPFWNTDRLLCIRVEGLPSKQAAEVKARVDADARAAGVSVGRAECGRRYQVEIRFAADADRAVREVLDYDNHPFWPLPMDKPIGDRPIRAWYGLVYDHAGLGEGHMSDFTPDPRDRTKFALAIVVVDPGRTQSLSLDAVSDYAAMLALTQPHALDHCNVLPSITDLFAGACPGRPAPTGLTAADAAYLKALYAGSPGLRATRYASELVDHMAKLLGPVPAPEASAPPPAATPPAATPATTTAPAGALIPAALTTAPAVRRLSIPDATAEASRFVQSYPAAVETRTVSSAFHYVVSFDGRFCVQVLGLPQGQAAAVASRINAVAQSLSLKLFSPYEQCAGLPNVSILFTIDPQHTLDQVIAKDRPHPGDSWSWIWKETTVSRPIQAWYQMSLCYAACGPGAVGTRVLGAVVLVDPRRIPNTNLSTIADYVAMLVLSEPRAPDRCQTLPSVMDLFAGRCGGRAAPTGLTPTDLAYLKAVYTAGARISRPDLSDGGGDPTQEEVAGRMGVLLAGGGTLPAPGVAPVAQYRPGHR